MMENREYYNTLFDIYGDLLTDIEKETFKNYYGEDLTIQEIADNRGISKASVSKTIKEALNKVNYYEEKLHLVELQKKLKELLQVDKLEEAKNIVRSILN